MIILDPHGRLLTETEAINKLFIQQQFLAVSLLLSENSLLSRIHSLPQTLRITREHQLKQLRDALRVLSQLCFGGGIQNRETGVDVPFVAVDPEHEVDLDVFDSARVSAQFPRELVVGLPGRAHGEEGRVRDGLCVCRDAVVHGCRDPHEFWLETAQDVFDEGSCGGRATVVDDHQRLAGGIDAGPVEGVAGHDLDV